MTTIDLSKRRFGNDYAFTPIANGVRGQVVGWSTPRPRAGDFLILRNGVGTTRYRVDDVHLYSDPDDMFSADVSFAPRDAKGTQA